MSKEHKKGRDVPQTEHEHLLAMTKPQLRSGYASALAEANLARGNTTVQHGRVLELEAELRTLHEGIERARAATASALVTLIRQSGVVDEVLDILGPDTGCNLAGADNCEDYS